MGVEAFFWLGASADAETGSREPSPSSTGLGPSGFDPARDKCVDCGRIPKKFIIDAPRGPVCHGCYGI